MNIGPNQQLTYPFILGLLLALVSTSTLAGAQPNILWLVTDDQRADSISTFNRMRFGTSNNPLGHVLSPNVDRLARMGTTFINTFNQNPGCAPSRTLMHTGRYSHRTGVYGFEYYNPFGQPHWRPMFPEILRDKAGYQTLAVGKLGIRAQHFSSKGGSALPLYETNLGYRREYASKSLVDWHKESKWVGGKPGPSNETFYFPQGERLHWPEFADANPNDRLEIQKKLELLRHYMPTDEDKQKGSILGGINPQASGRTRDGSFTNALLDHLAHAGESYTDMLGRKQRGLQNDKPLFAYVGFEFPHTPVLPPEVFRKKFQKLKYKIPEFTNEEYAVFPPQLKQLFANSRTDHFTDAEKHQMIADYYAYCAYGDVLVGQAVDGFIKFSETQGRPWLILYVCGDHGWRLNEHGMVSKFSHYDTDLHNPIIVVSSDKQKFPAGKVVEDFTCFVDMAPTFLSAAGVDIAMPEYEYLDGVDLADTVAGGVRPRDYIIAEPTWVIGPRAVIRTKDYKFAMKTRPRAGHTMTAGTAGKDFQWALTAELKDIEPTLFDLRADPDEVRNVAFDPRYRPVLRALRAKLQDIVLGDGRIEIAWTKTGTNLPAHHSNFAQGSNDGKLEVPVVAADDPNLFESAISLPDGMIHLVEAPKKTFDGRIFFINDWDGGDKDNQNAAEELNRNTRIRQNVTILSHLPNRVPKKVVIDKLVTDANILADASRKEQIVIAMGAHSRHVLAWLQQLQPEAYNFDNIVIVTHSNWNELDGRKGFNANRSEGDPPLADTHGENLRRGLYPNLARISDLGVAIWEIPRTDSGPGGWGGAVSTRTGEAASIKALDISDLGLIHYLKTGVTQATRTHRNEYVSDQMRKPEFLEEVATKHVERFSNHNRNVPLPKPR